MSFSIYSPKWMPASNLRRRFHTLIVGRNIEYDTRVITGELSEFWREYGARCQPGHEQAYTACRFVPQSGDLTQCLSDLSDSRLQSCAKMLSCVGQRNAPRTS